MQPDGRSTRPRPQELPTRPIPAASYWLARTLWALGEGYAAFRDADPRFRRVPEDRMDLAITALNRDVLAATARTRSSTACGCPTG